MTVIKVSFVVCDSCGTDHRHMGNAHEARRAAATAGWHRCKVEGKYVDRCPTCVASDGGRAGDRPSQKSRFSTPWSKAFVEVDAGASIRATALKYQLPLTTFWKRCKGRN